MTEIHKAQRVGVFVDVQNLYYSARYEYNAHVNFKSILLDAVKGRTLVRALAYVIRTEEVSKEKFFEALSHIGFEVRAKDLQIFAGGAKKGDWDIGIAMDAIELAPRLDTIVLVSGDGDFIPLVEHLKRALGCRVEVIAFGKSASGKLREAADDFTDLDKNIKRYCIKPAQKATPTRELDTHAIEGEKRGAK
ncbi:NYN domain-containing protein [Candidatus Woesearchaeota archaeon]|nr:NYN domain-containing protein [Candidatus Woesearchaeota archaeon]